MEGIKKGIAITALSAILIACFTFPISSAHADMLGDIKNKCHVIVKSGNTFETNSFLFSAPTFNFVDGNSILFKYDVKTKGSSSGQTQTPFGNFTFSSAFPSTGSTVVYQHIDRARLTLPKTGIGDIDIFAPAGDKNASQADGVHAWLNGMSLACSSTGSPGGTIPTPGSTTPGGSSSGSAGDSGDPDGGMGAGFNLANIVSAMLNCNKPNSIPTYGSTFQLVDIKFLAGSSQGNEHIQLTYSKAGNIVENFAYDASHSGGASTTDASSVKIRFKKNGVSDEYLEISPADIPMRAVKIDAAGTASYPSDENNWMGWFNKLNLKPDCTVFKTTQEAHMTGGETIGKAGAPRIKLPADPSLGRPEISFVLTRLVQGSGAGVFVGNAGIDFYFTYEKSIIGGTGKEETRYKNMAIRLTKTPATTNLHAVFFGNIMNPGDDSDKKASLLGSAGVRMNDQEILDHLFNKVFNKAAATGGSVTEVGPPPNTVTSAEYTAPGGILVTMINLNGYPSPDGAASTSQGWLKAWEVEYNPTYLSDPTGESTDRCSAAGSISPNPLKFGQSLNRIICEIDWQIYSLATSFYKGAVGMLSKSIGLHYK